MPATRVVIFEKKRLLESRLSTLSPDLPIDCKPVRTFDEFQAAIRESPFPIALIEHDENLKETVGLVKAASECSAQCVVSLRKPRREEARLLLRAAGATLLLDEMPVPSRWMVLIANMVRESQEQLRASGGG